MNRIGATFAEYFEAWDIQLPPNAVALKQRGKILKAGWHITYVFGEDHLDFFAEHRMTNPRHERIYSDGRCEALKAPREWCVIPADADEATEQQAWEEYYAYNRRVYAELRAKGLADAIDQTLPDGDGLTATTGRPSPRSLPLKEKTDMTDRTFRVNQLVVENRDTDDLTPITFAQLGFLRERDLRPWIENEPEFLGEDLLVVHRAHTVVRSNRLRLDVLAVDRDGALVVVEVKLRDYDDDPRWQAFLHAAACGQRSADDIVTLYAAFKGLDRKEAVARLKEHTGSKDEEDLKTKLNHRQRVVLIARSFRKQITTAALWLRKQGVDVSCIRLTPYLDEQTGAYYISRTEVIPPRATLDLLVDLVSTAGERERNAARLECHRDQIDQFWESVSDKVKARLKPDLVPSVVMDISKGVHDARHFRLRYQESPWNAYLFVRVGETEAQFRVTALLQWHEPSALAAGMSKPAIDKLRRLTATFAEKPGWSARMGLVGFYEAGKSIDVALDDEGAERATETLCEVVGKLYPRMERLLSKRVS